MTSQDNATEWAVVDLGTKLGSSIDAFRKRGAEKYGTGAAEIPAFRCLGIDLADKYRSDVEQRGYAFRAANLLHPDFQWGSADYYLAWDFLEHLPSIEDSNLVLAAMLEHATRGVWLKMPSFEQDEEGEGQLRRHGLRFTWTNWRGHPSFYRISDAMSVIQAKTPHGTVRHEQQRIIRDSSSKFVVPIDAPVDTTEYRQELGEKPDVTFQPAIIGCHDLIISLDDR